MKHTSIVFVKQEKEIDYTQFCAEGSGQTRKLQGCVSCVQKYARSLSNCQTGSAETMHKNASIE